ncbi:MAG TPA: hypothetical protein PKM65_07390 [Spirochaetota bacterium]|nr:hypothetical protein [Spirochaetota bacterium]HNT09817.1 hypothetical protein [Spirochaetota bacterium]
MISRNNQEIPITPEEKLQKSADFCKDKCPVCTRARKKGRGFLYAMVKFESKFCPHCKAYAKVYGKPAYK